MTSKKNHKKHCKKPCDDNCDHYMYIGEGDAICTKTENPKLVLDNWDPTENYAWCKNDKV